MKFPIPFLVQTFKCLYGLDMHHNIWFILLLLLPSQDKNLGPGMQLCWYQLTEPCLPKLGDRAFQSAAPKLWNSLPAEIRNIQSPTSFKRVLKTYFFFEVFSFYLFFYFILLFLLLLLLLLLLFFFFFNIEFNRLTFL